MPNRHARVLAVFVRDLDHFFASLLVQFGNADAQDSALDGRTKTQVGVRIALSTACTRLLSHMETESARGSETLIVAT